MTGHLIPSLVSAIVLHAGALAAQDARVHPDLRAPDTPSVIEDKAFFSPGDRWPSDSDGVTRVAVCWENPADLDPRDRMIVEIAATDTWQLYSGVRFLNWGPCTAADTRAIRIEVGGYWPHVTGLGTQLAGVRGGMKLNFAIDAHPDFAAECASAREACIRVIAVHEFGHALGFAHEQLRTDTPDDCLRRHPPQASDIPGTDTLGTGWDPFSIMNYCNPTWANGGHLSPGDVLAVQRAYGPPRG